MRIAVVHSFYSTASPSGENLTVRSQCAALSDFGHDVLLVERHTDTESASVLYPLRASVAASGFGGPSPVAALEKFAPDVVHVHNLFPNWGNSWLTSWPGPIVSTLHNFRQVCARGTLWRDGHSCTQCPDGSSFSAIKNRCYRESRLLSVPLAISTRGGGSHSTVLNRSDVSIVLNSHAQQVFGKFGRVEIVPNFVDDREYDSLGTGGAYWLYIGRLSEEKGIRWLLEQFPDSRNLKIAGSGPLEGLVQAAVNRSNVAFLGKLSAVDARRAISGARGVIVPSLWSEGIPTVALESLQSGTPLVVSNVCASASELTFAGAGEIVFVVDSGAASAAAERLTLVEAIDRIESGGSYRRHRARLLYESRYSRDAWREKIEVVYRSVINGTQG